MTNAKCSTVVTGGSGMISKNTRDPDQWGLASLWNSSMISDNRKPEKRDYIYASELGWSYYDRFWKMNGRKPTTPPNKRSLRKFEAGNLTEWTVQQILKRAGVFIGTQDRVYYDGEPIRVSGKVDFIAGGMIQPAEFDDLPEMFARIAERAYETLSKKYPNGLRKQILEIKSCSSLMFERYLIAPAENHALQAFHYARNMDMPTTIIYISKDDLRLTEWVVLPNNQRLERKYMNDLNQMAKILTMNKPPRETLFDYNPRKKTFAKNAKVEYSNFLTDYGFNRPDEYADKAGSIARRLNNVMKTIKNGKGLSKNNIEAIQLAISFDPNIKPLLEKLTNQ